LRHLLTTLSILIVSKLAAIGGAGQYHATIDYLYWKPFGLGLNISSQTVGERVNQVQVDPKYTSGVRGELSFQPCGSPFRAIGRYTWVDAEQSQRFFSPTDVTSLSVRTFYQAGDVLLAYDFNRASCFSWGFLAGAKILYIANHRSVIDSTASSLTETVRTRRFAGGGVAVGTAASWTPWTCFSLFGEVQYGCLFGTRRITARSLRSASTNQESKPIGVGSATREFDLRTGGRYQYQCQCVAIGLELGWELRAYPEYLTTSPINDQVGVGIGGLFAGVSASF